jgi:hypothetical protein
MAKSNGSEGSKSKFDKNSTAASRRGETMAQYNARTGSNVPF